MDIFKEAYNKAKAKESRSTTRDLGNGMYVSTHSLIIHFGYKHDRERDAIVRLLDQLKYYDEQGHNIDFTDSEKTRINQLINSDDSLNIELAKQIVLERLNNH